ncbi:MAG: methionine biosynthesis protein MetW, partial [Spirochaetota bacterium]
MKTKRPEAVKSAAEKKGHPGGVLISEKRTLSRENRLRLDHKIIASLIRPGTRVLDLGCGEGELLHFLTKKRLIQGYGIEISEQAIYKCLEKGLSVSHEDIDSGLSDYPEGFFDYVIFNQTMQQVHSPRMAILRALEIGNQVIIGFPNFCHLSARFQITLRGRVPVTHSLPFTWYDTPNLHFLSVRDFVLFCKKERIDIIRSFFLTRKGTIRLLPNLLAYNGIF